MAEKYWDSEEVVGEVKKDEFAKYIVSACTKGGKDYINVREWYCTRTDPNFRPAKSGMALPVSNNGDVSMQLISVMQDARKAFGFGCSV